MFYLSEPKGGMKGEIIEDGYCFLQPRRHTFYQMYGSSDQPKTPPGIKTQKLFDMGLGESEHNSIFPLTQNHNHIKNFCQSIFFSGWTQMTRYS